ncbi:hypothetical protein EDC04DRAFT_2906448 [Pisolithus marmoratus]|nr:hypothetical protein EDC04DRAFT_2906448 [Pisolithus marmoratus]
MPPKGSKSKGKSTEAKSRAGERSKKRVEDTLLMDQTAAKAPKLEETIEQLNMKNEKIKQAMLGLRFGKWNPRLLIKAQIMSLMESFQVNAVDRFNPAHVIPLIVPKNLIKCGTYTTEISNNTPIPVLQVSNDAPTNWGLPAAGGQHWVAALETWLEKKHAQLNEYIVKEHALRKQDPANVDEAELKQWNEGAKKEKDALEGVVAYEGAWIVSLFDDSMIDESLALHIARNETKHVYMESPMEGLIQLFKIMKAQRSDYQQVKLVPQSKGNASRQRELLRQDYVWDMLSQFDTAGVHYWHADFMLFTEFYMTMMASYGGILAYLVGCLERKLRMCFNLVEVDEKEVKILISNLRSKKAEAAQEKLEQLFDDLRNATPMPEAISNGIREAIDECFSSCIANMSGIHEIGNQSSADWVTIFAQYASEVPQKIQEQSKIVFACDTRHEDYAGFPFMSRSVFKILKKHLARIQSTIYEMSSWWSPYIYTTKIHPKEWNPGSASADMRRAVLAHPDYHIDCRNLLWDKIVLVLFESYPAALHMEGQILSSNIPDCMISQSELLNIFGMSLTSGVKKSKPAVPRKGKAKAKAKDDDGDSNYIEGETDVERDVDDDADDANDDDDKPFESSNEGDCDLKVESKISSDAIHNSFHGQELLRWHTWEWATQVGPSCTRNLRILGCITIFEACAIAAYWPTLLADLDGGAAALRCKIERESTIYRINRVSTELQQMTLLEKRKRPTKVAVSHTWPDGLTTNQSTTKVFDLDAELARHNYTILREAQRGQLQRVINCVETQRIAWDDTTNTVSIRDRPPLEPDVQEALEGLALNMNAYIQWRGLQVGDPVMKKPVENIDMLEVVYHTSDDVGLKLNSQKRKFVLLSRYEVERSKAETQLPSESTGSHPTHAYRDEDPSDVDLAIVSGASATHQSADNRFEILAPTGADAPSSNPDAGDDPMVDQDASKNIDLDADTSMEMASGKGNDSMDHAGDASLEKAVDKESGVSDESSDSASPLPHFGILSPPATAYSRPPDPPPLHNSDVDMFLRTVSSETQRSHQTSAQPSRKRPASKSLSSGDEGNPRSSSYASQSSHQAPPQFKQKLDGASSSSKLVNVAEADEDIGDQLG